MHRICAWAGASMLIACACRAQPLSDCYAPSLAAPERARIWAEAAPAPPHALAALLTLKATLAKIETLHFRAGALLEVRHPGPGQHEMGGVGTFEYWEDGPKYRLRAEVDPRLGLAPNVDAAFDREHFQFLLLEKSILSIQRADSSSLPSPVPNPLFLLIDFLSQDDDLCSSCATRVQSSRESEFWHSRVATARIPRGESNALVMLGGVAGGHDFLWLARQGGGPGEPRLMRLERVAPDGKTLSAASFDDYQPAGGEESLSLPHRILLQTFDAGGEEVARVRYNVNVLEVNRPIAASVFALDTKRVEKVWSSDQQSFTKYTNPKGVSCGKPAAPHP